MLAESEKKIVLSDSLRQNIEENLMEFSKKDFLIKCFEANFLQFSSATVKIFISDAQLGTRL